MSHDLGTPTPIQLPLQPSVRVLSTAWFTQYQCQVATSLVIRNSPGVTYLLLRAYNMLAHLSPSSSPHPTTLDRVESSGLRWHHHALPRIYSSPIEKEDCGRLKTSFEVRKRNSTELSWGAQSSLFPASPPHGTTVTLWVGATKEMYQFVWGS